MTHRTKTPDQLADRIRAAKPAGRRLLVAIAGAPGSGKSTLAADLTDRLNADAPLARLIPMDGFHLDNRLLAERGLLARKGAPETFDLPGFARMVAALARDETVYFPVFDRDRDIAIAAAGHAGPDCEIAIVEGNYLLLDEPGWRDLSWHWDISVYLDVPSATLRDRLVARWLSHGLPRNAAMTRTDQNDMANAERIRTAALPADIIHEGTPE